MRSSSTRRRTRQIAGIALVAAGAVVIAGCSSTTKSGGAATSAPLPGITASTVKVGFTIVDLGNLGKTLGFTQPDYGGVATQTKGIQAIVDYINKNGGMGGRQVTADIKPYLGSGDSPQLAVEQCNGYTQDDKVFAVVLDGGLQNGAVPCYKAANTLVLDETLIAHDTGQFELNSPYLWSPTHPEYGSFMKAQLVAMNEAKYFDGNTGVLLMPSDDEVSRRTTETIVKPYLQQIGVTKVQASYVDSTNIGTLGTTATAALTAGVNGNLNRVIVVGGARIAPVALTDPKANGYNSVWGISTYDNPTFIQRNSEAVVTALRVGMTGLGYAPPQDLSVNTDPAFPDPTNPMQQKCVEIVSAAGATPPENLRVNWKNVLQYCDGAMMLKAALDKLPGAATVTGAQFKDAVGQMGTTYRSSLTFGATWAPGVYAGTNAGQALSWDATTNAFKYTGTNVVFGPNAGAAPVATTAPTGAASVPGSVAPVPVPTSAAPTASVPNATSSVGTVPSTPASVGGVVTPYATITAPAS